MNNSRSKPPFRRRWLVFSAAFVALAGLWLAAVAGAFSFLKYKRGFTEVRFADMALPHRWPRFEVNRGNHYVTQAEQQLRNRDANGALSLLRAGLGKSPGNLRGRLLLADLYRQARRPDLARETFAEGMPHLKNDIHYAGAFLDFLSEQQDDTAIIAFATSTLDEHPAAPLQTLLLHHAAQAAYQRGNYDLADDFLSRLRSASPGTNLPLQAQVDWARGLNDLAVLRLSHHLTTHPGDTTARALLCDYYRQLSRTTDWQTTVVAGLAADPLAPGFRIEQLRILHHQGATDRFQRYAGDFFTQFADTPAALLQLAGFAAESGQPALARRVQAALPSDSEACLTATLLVAEAQLAAHDCVPALAALDAAVRTYPIRAEAVTASIHGLRAIALHGCDRPDEARLHLESLLSQPHLRVDVLTTLARRLDAVHARESALLLLARALKDDPLNEPALGLLLGYSLEADDPAAVVAHLEPYLRLRQPSPQLLGRARDLLGSDRHLFFEPQARTLAALSTALGRSR